MEVRSIGRRRGGERGVDLGGFHATIPGIPPAIMSKPIALLALAALTIPASGEPARRSASTATSGRSSRTTASSATGRTRKPARATCGSTCGRSPSTPGRSCRAIRARASWCDRIHSPRSRRPDAAAEEPQGARRGREEDPAETGSRRGGIRAALGLHPASGSAPSRIAGSTRCGQRFPAGQRARSIPPGGRPPHLDPAGHARPDRPAADAGRGRARSSPTRRPDAYERLVERLLASPHYGERMAVPWLDLGALRRHGRLPRRPERATSRPTATTSSTRSTTNMPFDQFTDRAARRRPAAGRDRRAADRDRLQPAQP